ncbi:MAG TPA: hypothetical protein VHH88_12430 [Verrucomicrobiae bacterium]|nr:hypothetical protein [Verrucomicrobiae bacterium]
MHAKMYKMRGLTLRQGKNTVVDLELQFEGKRAFAVWESIPLGNYELKARVEIDPSLLERIRNHGCDFLYRGRLILPEPRDN